MACRSDFHYWNKHCEKANNGKYGFRVEFKDKGMRDYVDSLILAWATSGSSSKSIRDQHLKGPR